MIDWKGNKKPYVSGSIEGEPVKVFNDNGAQSFIYLGFREVEYVKSRYITSNIEGSAYKTIKVYLN